jgi:hypothetical protein
MNGRAIGSLFVIAAVAVTMLSWSRAPQEVVNAQPVAKAQQWEYKVVTVTTEEYVKNGESEFNKLGADGWEHSGNFLAGGVVFKRPKR